MFTWAENVYYVKGKKRACIYDFNSSELLHLTADEVQFIEKVINQKLNENELTSPEHERIDYLLRKKIVMRSSHFNSGDIHELARKPQIDFAWIEVTQQCNLKCIHCYDDSCIQNNHKMGYMDFKYVIDELYDYGVRKIQIIGGEPFVIGKSLKEYIKYASEKMNHVEIFTNATLLDEDWCRFLIENKVYIAISVYSYDSSMHDSVTNVNSSYTMTIHGIELLKKYQIHYRVANVLMNGIELGEKNTDLFTLSSRRDVVRLTGRANMDLLNRELLSKKLITKKSFSNKLNKEKVSRMIYGHNCFSRRLYVATDLTVYPCVMERRISHGNLKNCSLRDIIKEEILKYSKDKVAVCNECEFRYCCHDCRPDSLGRDIHEKPWMCTYNPEEGTWTEKEEFISELICKIK